MTFSDSDNDGIVSSADIKQINHYYPFGLNMEGNWNGASGNNKYQYNNKEWNDDFGLGWNDYGARFYDPSVSRWWNVDPLAEYYTNLTNYSYVANIPTQLIDPTGMAIEHISGGTRYTGEDAKFAFMQLQQTFNSRGNIPTIGGLEKSLTAFANKFNEAKEATKADGIERGYIIYLGSDNKLYTSAMIKGDENENVINTWHLELDNPTAILSAGITIKSLAGIYHTHPDNGEDGNPYSPGDVDVLLSSINQGNYISGWNISTGFFTIADDVNGGRYASVIEDYKKAKSFVAQTRDKYNNSFDGFVGVNSTKREGTVGHKQRVHHSHVFTSDTGIGIYYSPNNESVKLNRLNPRP